jgi:hypothetical protein
MSAQSSRIHCRQVRHTDLQFEALRTVASRDTDLLATLDATTRNNAEQQLTEAANADFVCGPRLPVLLFPKLCSRY